MDTINQLKNKIDGKMIGFHVISRHVTSLWHIIGRHRLNVQRFQSSLRIIMSHQISCLGHKARWNCNNKKYRPHVSSHANG